MRPSCGCFRWWRKEESEYSYPKSKTLWNSPLLSRFSLDAIEDSIFLSPFSFPAWRSLLSDLLLLPQACCTRVCMCKCVCVCVCVCNPALGVQADVWSFPSCPSWWKLGRKNCWQWTPPTTREQPKPTFSWAKPSYLISYFQRSQVLFVFSSSFSSSIFEPNTLPVSVTREHSIYLFKC